MISKELVALLLALTIWNSFAINPKDLKFRNALKKTIARYAIGEDLAELSDRIKNYPERSQLWEVVPGSDSNTFKSIIRLGKFGEANIKTKFPRIVQLSLRRDLIPGITENIRKLQYHVVEFRDEDQVFTRYRVKYEPQTTGTFKFDIELPIGYQLDTYENGRTELYNDLTTWKQSHLDAPIQNTATVDFEDLHSKTSKLLALINEEKGFMVKDRVRQYVALMAAEDVWQGDANLKAPAPKLEENTAVALKDYLPAGPDFIDLLEAYTKTNRRENDRKSIVELVAADNCFDPRKPLGSSKAAKVKELGSFLSDNAQKLRKTNSVIFLDDKPLELGGVLGKRGASSSLEEPVNSMERQPADASVKKVEVTVGGTKARKVKYPIRIISKKPNQEASGSRASEVDPFNTHETIPGTSGTHEHGLDLNEQGPHATLPSGNVMGKIPDATTSQLQPEDRFRFEDLTHEHTGIVFNGPIHEPDSPGTRETLSELFGSQSVLGAVEETNFEAAADSMLVSTQNTPGPSAQGEQCSPGTGNDRVRSAECTLTEEEKNGEWSVNEATEEVTENGYRFEMVSRVTGKKIVMTQSIPESENPLHIWRENAIQWAGRVGKGIGRVSAVFSILSAAYAYQQGQYGQAAAIGSMTVFQVSTDIVSSVPSLRKAVIKATAKTITKAAEGIGELAKLDAAGIASTAELMSAGAEMMIPLVGIGFGCWMIWEDMGQIMTDDHKDIAKTIVLFVNLFLDVATTILSVAAIEFPPLEVVVMALTLTRMTFGLLVDGYETSDKFCREAMEEGPVACFFFDQEGPMVNLITFGEIAKAEKAILDYIKRLRNGGTYMTYDGDCDGSDAVTINFNAGESSPFAGGIKFHLTNDQYVYFTIPNIPNWGERYEDITWKFKHHCKMLRNIVLGAGESQRLSYEKKTAYILGLIPYDAGRVITNRTLIKSSRKGEYIGNDRDNTLYTVSGEVGRYHECNFYDEDPFRPHQLLPYRYRMFGMGGNDKFFLGPEEIFVEGGKGSDTYIVDVSGSDITIDNFAQDEATDILFVNTTYENIGCGIDGDSLYVTYCAERLIKIKNWFIDKRFRHLRIRIAENFIIEHLPPEGYCLIVAIDSSEANEPLVIDLDPPSLDLQDEDEDEYRDFSYVRTVVGTRYDDKITGNNLDNVIIGGEGLNHLSGGGGKDVYVIGKNSINKIYYENNDTARIQISANYHDLTLRKYEGTLILESNENEIRVEINNWQKLNTSSLSLVSEDFFVFGIQEIKGNPIKVPYILDYSQRKRRARVNLRTHYADEIPKGTVLNEVRNVIGSNYSDHMVGNEGNNMFVCRGTGVYMEGGGGVDVYYISKSCDATIELKSTDSAVDVVTLPCRMDEVSVCQGNEKSNDLILSCSAGGSETCQNQKTIRIKEWKKMSSGRDFRARTTNGLQLRFENFRKLGAVTKQYLTVSDIFISGKENINGSNLDLCWHKNKEGYHDFRTVASVKVNQTTGNTDIRGNNLANTLDPGPKLPGYVTYLEGRNGSDTYILSGQNGWVTINNKAEDEFPDILVLSIPFKNIEVAFDFVSGGVILLNDQQPNDTRVNILNFLRDGKFRHLVIKTADHIQMNITGTYPYKEALIIDRSSMLHPQSIHLSLNRDSGYSNVKAIYGSNWFNNTIFGGHFTEQIVGGLKDDRLHGGSHGETMEGYDGNDSVWGMGGDDVLKGGPGDDSLYGGRGNDVLYGGTGSDYIDGGPGVDFVIFQGGVTEYGRRSGVHIDLLDSNVGISYDSTGDLFVDIEVFVGTAFGDKFVDDDGDREYRTGPGDDTILVSGGNDRLIGDSGNDFYAMMSKARGHKIIDNFDNSTSMTKDRISIDVYALKPEFRSLHSDSLFDLLHCTFSVGENLILKVNEKLTFTLYNWYLSDHYRHLEIKFEQNQLNERSAYDIPEQYPMLRLKPHEMPYLIVRKLESYHVVMEIKNVSNPEYIEIHVNSSDESVALPVMQTTYDSYRIERLHPGTIYSLQPVTKICNTVIEKGESVFIITRPNPPRRLRLHSIEGGILRVQWSVYKRKDRNRKWYAYVVIVREVMKRKGKKKTIVTNKYITRNLFGFAKLKLKLRSEKKSSLKVKVGVKASYYGSNSTTVWKSSSLKNPFSCTSAKRAWGNVPGCQKNKFDDGGFPKDHCSKGRSRVKSETQCSRQIPCSSPIIMNRNIYPSNLLTDEVINEHTYFADNDTIELKCKSSFTFARKYQKDESFKSRCSAGIWIPNIPTCYETCKPLPSPKNGRSFVHGNIALIRCDWKLYMTGPSRSSCENKRWIPEVETTCRSEEYFSNSP